MKSPFVIFAVKNNLFSFRHILFSIIVLLVILTFFLFFKIYESLFSSFYYVETSFGDISLPPNTTDQYKKHCKDNIEDDSICQKIHEGFFYDSFHGECLAVKYNDISSCDLMQDNERKRFCRKNFQLYQIILSSDHLRCEDLGETHSWEVSDDSNLVHSENYNELSHNNKSNIQFCRSAVSLFLNPDHSEINNFVTDYFWGDKRFAPRVFGVFSQDSKYCWDATWIDERIKCLIYTRGLQCDKLSDTQYIYELIDKTTHFHDNGADGL